MASNDSEQEVDLSTNQAKKTKICKVCGATPAGFNYCAMSCGACKVFFLRTYQNGSQDNYYCLENKSCDITVKSRKDCKYCRFQKCLKVGMNLPDSEKQKYHEQCQARLLAKKPPEPEPVYSEVDAVFLTDVSAASDLAFGLKKKTTFKFPRECDRREIIRKSFELSTDRAYNFLSNISLVKEMSRRHISEFTQSRLVPVVYMRSILLFPRLRTLIQSKEEIISQSGLTDLIRSFRMFSNQLEMEFKEKEFILLPLYCVINDNEDGSDVNQSPVVKNIRERVKSHLSNQWSLPAQQVLLNSILKLSGKHKKNLSKLNVDVSDFPRLHKIFNSMFDISVW